VRLDEVARLERGLFHQAADAGVLPHPAHAYGDVHDLSRVCAWTNASNVEWWVARGLAASSPKRLYVDCPMHATAEATREVRASATMPPSARISTGIPASSSRPAVAGAIAATIGLGSGSVAQAWISPSAPKVLLTSTTFGPGGFHSGHGNVTRSMQGTATAS